MRISATGGGAPRLGWVDVARTVAIANMVAFHFLYDLALFGWGPAPSLAWAKGIAGSFLFLAGGSLWLAHGGGTRWRAFGRRLGVLALAAAAVSLATWVAMPGLWVRWGILHAIAAGSVAGVLALRLPWWAVGALGAACLALRAPLREMAGGLVEGPVGIVTGLARAVPATMDYEPLLPWTGPLLLGLAAAKLADRAGWLEWSARLDPAGGWPGWATWPGRHSLAIYLLHQPVLFGGMGLVALATR